MKKYNTVITIVVEAENIVEARNKSLQVWEDYAYNGAHPEGLNVRTEPASYDAVEINVNGEILDDVDALDFGYETYDEAAYGTLDALNLKIINIDDR